MNPGRSLFQHVVILYGVKEKAQLVCICHCASLWKTKKRRDHLWDHGKVHDLSVVKILTDGSVNQPHAHA
jgi:hypothetical protein